MSTTVVASVIKPSMNTLQPSVAITFFCATTILQSVGSWNEQFTTVYSIEISTAVDHRAMARFIAHRCIPHIFQDQKLLP